MNTYELMPLLIKAALENDRKTLESVAIITLSTQFASHAALAVQYTSGFPFIGFMFFKGIDLLPPRTGIKARFI